MASEQAEGKGLSGLFRRIFGKGAGVIRRLRRKFVLINMLIVTVMLAVIFTLVYEMTARNLREQADAMLRIGMDNPQNQHGPGGDFRSDLWQDPENPESAEADAEKEPEEDENPGADGTPDTDSGTAIPPDGIPDEAFPDFSDRIRELDVMLPYLLVRLSEDGEAERSGGSLELDDEELAAAVSEILQSGEDTGLLRERKLRFHIQQSPMGKSVILVDISGEQQTLKNLIRTFLLIGAGAFIAFLLISIFLARWAVRPVEQAFREQRQFVSDASHELKTPLTVILSNAEMLKNPAFSAEEKAQFAENILTESRSMRTLTENLLSLARSDNDTVELTMDRLSLSELAEDAALPFDAVFFEKGLMLDTDLEPETFVKGSERQLRECVGILLDNALKYADPDTTVLLSVKKRSNSAFLSVTNIGPEIPEEALKNVFKRFYRATGAREADGSYGLGLSILESYVEKHGGRCFAKSEFPRNTFGFRLPLI